MKKITYKVLIDYEFTNNDIKILLFEYLNMFKEAFGYNMPMVSLSKNIKKLKEDSKGDELIMTESIEKSIRCVYREFYVDNTTSKKSGYKSNINTMNDTLSIGRAKRV